MDGGWEEGGHRGTVGQPEIEAHFDRIIRGHGDALRRLARAYARDTADADDLFQEICLGLWRALPTFRGECSERTFTFRIGHNRGLTYRARRRPEPDEIDESVADQAPGPETVLGASIRHDGLLAAVRRLPESQRQVVLLSLEGLGNSEIGEVLGVTENGVAIRLTRARKALRELLGPDWGTG